MATRYPAKFRERAVELARLREKRVTQIATDLGISDQTLRNWLRRADIDEGRREGLKTEERAEIVRLRRANRVFEKENEILKRAAFLRARERAPNMTFRLVQELAAGGVLAAVACRVLRVSTSGYYERRGRTPSQRAAADTALTAQIMEIHASGAGCTGPRCAGPVRFWSTRSSTSTLTNAAAAAWRRRSTGRVVPRPPITQTDKLCQQEESGDSALGCTTTRPGCTVTAPALL